MLFFCSFNSVYLHNYYRMRKLQVVVLFLCVLVCFDHIQAQSEVDSLSAGKTIVVERKPIQLQSLSFTSLPSSLNMYRFNRQKLSDLPFKTPTIAIPRFDNSNYLALNLNNNLNYVYPLTDNSFITTQRTSTNYIGLGGIYQVGANYNYQLGDFGVLTAGAYAAKFNIYNNFYNSAGVNGNFKLRINDRISMNLFGQYTPTTKTSIMQVMSPMYPQTNYGGSFEFKVTDKWGVAVGAEREFDVFSRKWVTRPFFMPVFYGR